MTLIYCDGYFRTGSNFLQHSLKIAYPEADVTSYDPVPHYGVGLIKDLTIYSGLAVSLRDPLHTLGSVFSFFRIENSSEEKAQHIRALKGYLVDIQTNKENIFMSDFNEMADDVNLVMQKFYQKFPEVGAPAQVEALAVTDSLLASGKSHAVPGFNTEDKEDLYSRITADFTTELEELRAIYNEILA